MVGEKSYTLLRNMGVHRIHTLQETEAFTMRRVMGENGVTIWRKANGEDNTPVVPFHEQKSMSKETTFQQDTIDMDFLKRTLASMVDKLAFAMSREQKLTGCLTLKIRYRHFDPHHSKLKVPSTKSKTTNT